MRSKRHDLKTQDDQKRAQASQEEVGPLPALQMGGCPNYGPFLGPGTYYLGYPKRTTQITQEGFGFGFRVGRAWDLEWNEGFFRFRAQGYEGFGFVALF